MTIEDKRLLLKDLSARWTYGVICHTNKGNGYLCSINQTIFGTEYGLNISPVKRDYFNDTKCIIKPYLRPMESMTEEELFNYKHLDLLDYSNDGFEMPNFRSIDWLNAQRFDYRGLIEKGLALEAPKDMYKED